MKNIRIGQGYDVHIFGPGDFVILGGVHIPHNQAVIAHSDGDVVLHALCDAIYGAIGEGDIGTHFPPSEEKWRDCASDVFLKDARQRMKKSGYHVGNIDITVIAEAPKIGPHRDLIKENIAKILQIEPVQVAVKATTNEKMGAIGRQEGLAAIAVVLLLGD